MNLPLLGAALAMGFFGSSHCVGMCGGIVGALSGGLTPLRTKDAPAPSRTPSALLLGAYNLGRIATYSGLGAVAGWLGAQVHELPWVRDAGLALRLGAGVLLVLLGLHLAGLLPHYANVERLGLPVWRRLSPLAHRLVPARSTNGALLLGMLWGFLPCGLVVTAIGVSMTSGSPLGGAATMCAFGLGTLPAMFAVGAAAAEMGHAMKRVWVRRLAGGSVLVLGALQLVAVGRQAATPPKTEGASCCHGPVAEASIEAR